MFLSFCLESSTNNDRKIITSLLMNSVEETVIKFNDQLKGIKNSLEKRSLFDSSIQDMMTLVRFIYDFIPERAIRFASHLLELEPIILFRPAALRNPHGLNSSFVSLAASLTRIPAVSQKILTSQSKFFRWESLTGRLSLVFKSLIQSAPPTSEIDSVPEMLTLTANLLNARDISLDGSKVNVMELSFIAISIASYTADSRIKASSLFLIESIIKNPAILPYVCDFFSLSSSFILPSWTYKKKRFWTR